MIFICFIDIIRIVVYRVIDPRALLTSSINKAPKLDFGVNKSHTNMHLILPLVPSLLEK